jgi:hypothetical protein
MSSSTGGGQSRSLILTAMIFAVAMTFIESLGSWPCAVSSGASRRTRRAQASSPARARKPICTRPRARPVTRRRAGSRYRSSWPGAMLAPLITTATRSPGAGL